MKVNFNVIKNEKSIKSGIDFTPTKANNSDIAFDVRANNIIVDSGNKVIEDWTEYSIPSGQSIIIGIGVSLINAESIKMPSNTAIQYIIDHLHNLEDRVCRDMGDLEYAENKIKINNRYSSERFIDTFFPSSEMHSRSGLAFKSDINCFNGQIDNTYGNEIRVKLTNNGRKPFKINYGDRIGQLEIKLIPEVDVDVNNVSTISELNNDKRGGFGSTGLNKMVKNIKE